MALYWHKNINVLPSITFSFVENFYKINCLVVSTSNKAYKFFLEGYIHEFEVANTPKQCFIRAKCFRSQRRNDQPHDIKIIIGRDPVEITGWHCTCAAGRDLCHHTMALLYTACHYQQLQLSSVPADVSKTALPQAWHVPTRTRGIAVRPVQDIVVQQPRPVIHEPASKRRRSVAGIRSTLFNPIRDELSRINFVQKISPYFQSIPVNQRPQFATLWSSDFQQLTTMPLVGTRFGYVQHGCVLAYQQKSSGTSDSACDNIPPFAFLDISTKYNYVLSEKEFHADMSLRVTEQQAIVYECQSRQQSECVQWREYRQNRLTASHFKSIVTRQADYDKLSQRLTSKRFIQTAAMRYGLQQEPIAADQYAKAFNMKLYSVGFVINPSAHFIGCSPDRRVYDPSSDSFGLLEIKCPSVEKVRDCKYLKVSGDELLLCKTHEYYYQIIGQLGITGCEWCDFFVLSHSDYHKERIAFDANMWHRMRATIDMYYFQHFLPYIARL